MTPRGDHVEDDPVPPRLLVAELVGGADGLDRRGGGFVVAGVDLGEDVAAHDGVTTLGPTDDAHCVVDVIGFRPATGTELERRVTDGKGAKTGDDAVAGGEDLTDDQCHRQSGGIGVATLGVDPALVGRQRRTVGDRRLGLPQPAFSCVDAEVGHGQQPHKRRAPAR